MGIQAIQTVYNGYKFRSRLEARWAVFFDHMGIKYQYEPEGFEIDHRLLCLEDVPEKCYAKATGWGCNCPSTYYLPDFYLPELDTYFEVKGPEMGIEEQIKLLNATTGLSSIVLGGNFDKNMRFPAKLSFHKGDVMAGPFNFIDDWGPGLHLCSDYSPIQGIHKIPKREAHNSSEMFEMVMENFLSESRERSKVFSNLGDYEKSPNMYPLFSGMKFSSKYRNAYLKAQQARFEHGEKG